MLFLVNKTLQSPCSGLFPSAWATIKVMKKQENKNWRQTNPFLSQQNINPIVLISSKKDKKGQKWDSSNLVLRSAIEFGWGVYGMYGNDTLHKGILYSIVEQYMSTPLKRMVSTLCTVLSALKRREIGLDGVQFAQHTTSLGVKTRKGNHNTRQHNTFLGTTSERFLHHHHHHRHHRE